MNAHEVNLNPLYEMIRQDLDISSLTFESTTLINGHTYILSELIISPKIFQLFSKAYVEILLTSEEESQTPVFTFDCILHLVKENYNKIKFASAMYGKGNWRYFNHA